MSRDRVALGIALGYAADRLLGDPRRGHPVAGFGRVAAGLEQRIWGSSRSRGTAYEVVLVGGAVGAGLLLDRLPAATRVPVVAAVTWVVLGGRSLTKEAQSMSGLLVAEDLDGARLRVRNLVGRDPSALDADELARATVESVAENGADAVVAPLFWGAVAGLPGLVGYRAINTLDAMVGHRTPRHERFGWAAARVDDAANWLPARLTVLATAAATGSVDGARSVLATVRRDAGRHPSPNAGPVEAAFAAALGRSLGGSNSYAGVVEDRGRLGDGPPVTVADIAPASRLQTRIGLLSLGALLGARAVSRAALRRRRRARPGRPRPSSRR
ncbi:adenosylcobinamide-phosphate synthase CbiB [Pedococcus sp. NPDC057267]|uniref:adenosylcobinamide-phosphate synthase CbiB n=1 Tax=Pedococcus sp. NPDC057267 TaxID=3346077 RepID=UPI003633F35C